MGMAWTDSKTVLKLTGDNNNELSGSVVLKSRAQNKANYFISSIIMQSFKAYKIVYIQN